LCGLSVDASSGYFVAFALALSGLGVLAAGFTFAENLVEHAFDAVSDFARRVSYFAPDFFESFGGTFRFFGVREGGTDLGRAGGGFAYRFSRKPGAICVVDWVVACIAVGCVRDRVERIDSQELSVGWS
jgi:hypothetical protein